ncbi:MAG: 30S ribosomal protein S16 [Myxococcota bacterium]|nr:30S ribosomal protein S16 [Myxococcota bacterium]
MVRIRLQRGGAKKRPFYRVIAIDERAKRDGRALEFLGTYNPVVQPPHIQLATERIEAWERNGAQLSDAVRGLVKRARKQAQADPSPPSAPRPAPPKAAPEEAEAKSEAPAAAEAAQAAEAPPAEGATPEGEEGTS